MQYDGSDHGLQKPPYDTPATPSSPATSTPNMHNIPETEGENSSRNVNSFADGMMPAPRPPIPSRASTDEERTSFPDEGRSYERYSWQDSTTPAHIYARGSEIPRVSETNGDQTDDNEAESFSDETSSDEDNLKSDKESVPGVIQEVARLFPWEGELNPLYITKYKEVN